jgi:hypothetical protein
MELSLPLQPTVNPALTPTTGCASASPHGLSDALSPSSPKRINSEEVPR